MSLNMIVVAVIAIIVLVVLIMIFSGKMKMFGKTASGCETKGGSCETACASGYIKQLGTDCGVRFENKEEGVKGPNCCTPFDDYAVKK